MLNNGDEMSFPLLFLPPGAQVNIIGQLTIMQIIGISFLSETMKSLVMALDFGGCRSVFFMSMLFNSTWITGGYIIDCVYEMQFGDDRDPQNQEVPTTISIYVDIRDRLLNDVGRCRINKTLELTEYIDHFFSIFRCSKFATTALLSPHLNFENVLGALGNRVTLLQLATDDEEYNTRALKKLRNYNMFGLNSDVLPERQVPRDIWMQNFETLQVEGDEPVRLDQLLLSTGKRLMMRETTVDVKILKRLLKLWQKGANPRLEHLEAQVTGNIDSDWVLQFSAHAETERTTENWKTIFRTTGEMFNINGTKAVICVETVISTETTTFFIMDVEPHSFY